MSKIIGVTVGTPVSAELIKKKLKPVLSVNGVGADDNGNVEVEVSGGGTQGPPGPQGAKGDPGEKGAPGEPGPAGTDGYTPVKGVDYWTEEDKAEIVGKVLAEVPPGGGAGVFAVHGTINYSAQTFSEVEETYGQISAALDAGQQVVVLAVDDENGGLQAFQYIGSDGGQTPGHYFASTNGADTNFSLGVFYDNSWQLIKTEFTNSGFSGWSDDDKEQMMDYVLQELPVYDLGVDYL